MRPSRYLFALLTIFVVLFLVVIATGSGSFSNRFRPRLGLDLVGGTTLTLNAKPVEGQKIDRTNLETARNIIEKRVNGYGVAEATVVVEGSDTIIVSVPGKNNQDIRQVGTPAQMRFRKVLNSATDSPATTPATSAPATSAPASPGAASSAPATSAPATTPPASTTAPPTSSAAASGSASPSASAGPSLADRQAAILKKLGSGAVSAATQLVSQNPSQPLDAATKAALTQQLEPFRTLTGEEVSILPVQYQFGVPQITCQMLAERPTGSIVDPSQQAVACEDQGHTKLLMDKATVLGTDLSTAQANLDTSGAGWKVDLTFSSEGTAKWTALTSEAYNNKDSACLVTQPNSDTAAANKQVCQVAVVLDNTVVSAPAIQGVLTSTSQISGSFNKDSATLLANQLKYGALPLTFEQGNLSSVSATLGADYLRAGLLAMGVGMLLVIVYAFFYYRLLGSVIFGSLVLSGLLTFLMLVFLGRQLGFTLSLAGIAGFIVSLGVAADSFVIYFERLKDEIREGRSPRSAIPRAWVRARRTIVTANAVTILAALVLYIIGASQVKGFAFALGLATSLDLLIVFLFRHPIMTMLARMPAFLSPRVSGLGRVLHHASRDDAPASRPTRSTRSKEA
jgi:preprotein translocase subunit SecD